MTDKAISEIVRKEFYLGNLDTFNNLERLKLMKFNQFSVSVILKYVHQKISNSYSNNTN